MNGGPSNAEQRYAVKKFVKEQGVDGWEEAWCVSAYVTFKNIFLSSAKFLSLSCGFVGGVVRSLHLEETLFCTAYLTF